METTTAGAETKLGSYRVKFDTQNFRELFPIAKPRMIYRRKNMYFFAYNGFVMYCDQGDDTDFSQRIIDATEFANYHGQKNLLIDNMVEKRGYNG